MKSLKESLLSDMEETLSKGDDEIAKEHIYRLLDNKEWFSFGIGIKGYDHIKNKVILHKKGKKWIVDVKRNITCYCPNGYITDGSFEFNTIGRDFIITNKESTGNICNCKSLKYGPKLVNNHFCIYYCPNLKNLKYCPEKVMDSIVIGYTGIETLKYFPEYSVFVELVGNKNIKNLNDTTDDVFIQDGIRIINNGFKSSMKDLKNCKWKFIKDYSYFIFDKEIKTGIKLI